MASRKDEAVGFGGTGASNWSEPTKSSSMGFQNFIPDEVELENSVQEAVWHPDEDPVDMPEDEPVQYGKDEITSDEESGIMDAGDIYAQEIGLDTAETSEENEEDPEGFESVKDGMEWITKSLEKQDYQGAINKAVQLQELHPDDNRWSIYADKMREHLANLEKKDQEASQDISANSANPEFAPQPEEESEDTASEIERLAKAAENARIARSITPKRKRGRKAGQKDKRPGSRRMIKGFNVVPITDDDLIKMGLNIEQDPWAKAGDASDAELARIEGTKLYSDAELAGFDIDALEKKQADAPKRSEYLRRGMDPNIVGWKPNPNRENQHARWPDVSSREVWDPIKTGFVRDEKGNPLTNRERAALSRHYRNELLAKAKQDKLDAARSDFESKSQPKSRFTRPEAGKMTMLTTGEDQAVDSEAIEHWYPGAMAALAGTKINPDKGTFVMVDDEISRPKDIPEIDPDHEKFDADKFFGYHYKLGAFVDMADIRNLHKQKYKENFPRGPALVFIPTSSEKSHWYWDSSDMGQASDDEDLAKSGKWVKLGNLRDRKIKQENEEERRIRSEREKKEKEDKINQLIRWWETKQVGSDAAEQETSRWDDDFADFDTNTTKEPTPEEMATGEWIPREIKDKEGNVIATRWFNAETDTPYDYKRGLNPWEFRKLTSPTGKGFFSQEPVAAKRRIWKKPEEIAALRTAKARAQAGLNEEIEMDIKSFFMFEAHGENAVIRPDKMPDERPDTDPDGQLGFQGGEPNDEPTFQPAVPFDDPSSSQDEEHGGFSEQGSGVETFPDPSGGTLTAPEGVFQAGDLSGGEEEDSFGPMVNPIENGPDDNEQGEPMPGGPDDPEVGGVVGDPGFGREEDDNARMPQTGEPDPSNRMNPQMPGYEYQEFGGQRGRQPSPEKKQRRGNW